MPQQFLEEGKRKYTLFQVRPYKKKELAALYGLPIRTFERWLFRIRTKLGEIDGHYLTIPQVEIVIQHYQMPYYILVEVEDEDKAASKNNKAHEK